VSGILTHPKMPFSDQFVLDGRNDHAALTWSAESSCSSCRYSLHERNGHTSCCL
jgi:hypothetical protein